MYGHCNNEATLTTTFYNSCYLFLLILFIIPVIFHIIADDSCCAYIPLDMVLQRKMRIPGQDVVLAAAGSSVDDADDVKDGLGPD